MDQRGTYVLELVAAIVERGDEELWDSTLTEGRWCIDLLLGLLGYEMHVTDGDVELWPKDGDQDGVIYPKYHRTAKTPQGAWLHGGEDGRPYMTNLGGRYEGQVVT
jgi:hypothetical protein